MTGPILQLHGILAVHSQRRASDHPHRILRLGRLSALVSRCPFDGLLDAVAPSDLTERIMAHHQILLTYCADYAVLPTRFGAFFSSIHALRERLAKEESTHLNALAHLKDLHEFAIKLSLTSRCLTPPSSPTSDGSGAQFLARRRNARNARQSTRQDRLNFANGVATALSSIAPVVSYEQGDALLHMGILLSETDQAALRTLLQERGPRADELGLSLQATGPWPAYSFDTHQLNKVANGGS